MTTQTTSNQDLLLALFKSKEGIESLGVTTYEGVMTFKELAEHFTVDANSDQLDSDSDGLGNVCDPTPYGSTFSCTETTASNYSHVQANRATTNGAYVYAIGSGESMGFYNIFSTATLAETSENYYEVGNCP